MTNIFNMLSRGFGLVSLNDFISLTYHDDILECHFAALPGEDPETVYLNERTVGGIINEVHDYMTQYLINYHAALEHTLIRLLETERNYL